MRSWFCTEVITGLERKMLFLRPLHLSLRWQPWKHLQAWNLHHSCSSLLALKTYRDSSSCRPNGCRAQGVSKSGSDFGPRQRSVATVASDQTWTRSFLPTSKAEVAFFWHVSWISFTFNMYSSPNDLWTGRRHAMSWMITFPAALIGRLPESNPSRLLFHLLDFRSL